MSDIHISGLGQTSFDISGIIEKMLVIKAEPQKAWIEEQDEIANDVAAWSDVTALMTNLTNSLDTLRSYDLWNKMSATTSDASKLTATASTAAVSAAYSISVTHLAQAHSVRSKAFNSATANLASGGTGDLNDGDQFKIGGITFTVGADEQGQTVDGTESLTSLAAKINYASSSMTAADRVTASVVSAGATEHYLVLTRANTGDTCIDSADTAGTALQDLAIRADAGPGDNYVTNIVNHQDASFSVNTIAMTRSTNLGLTDVIGGVTFNLLDATTTPVTLTVAEDRASAKAAILDFIDQYNAAAAKMTEYGQISTLGSSLDPKGAVVDSKGELYDDSLLADILRNIRLQATGTKYPYLNPVNASYAYKGKTGVMCSLQDIGIGTLSRENQLSVLDENRLDSLLDSDFSKVEQLFRGIYDEKNGYQHGVASDFYQYARSVSTSMTGSIAQRVNALDSKTARLQQQIDDLDTSLKDYEQMLWERFTAMDTAITKLQSSLAGLSNLTSSS